MCPANALGIFSPVITLVLYALLAAFKGSVTSLFSCHESPSFMFWNVLEYNTLESVAGLTSYCNSCDMVQAAVVMVW
jgi:hypothetical protein